MTRRAKVILAAAAPFAGFGAAWAYSAAGPTWFLTGCATAVLLAMAVCLYYALTGEGRHGGKGTSRDEETTALFAEMGRPAEVASEPPWYLAAPVAVPEVTHDEYAPQQSYDGVATAYGTVLISPLGVALAAVTALRGLAEKALAGPGGRPEAEARRLRAQVQRLEDERDFPHSASPVLWPSGEFRLLESDTFVGGIPVVLDEDGLVKTWTPPDEAAVEKAGQTP
jgi:hypothetical protein